MTNTLLELTKLDVELMKLDYQVSEVRNSAGLRELTRQRKEILDCIIGKTRDILYYYQIRLEYND